MKNNIDFRAVAEKIRELAMFGPRETIKTAIHAGKLQNKHTWEYEVPLPASLERPQRELYASRNYTVVPGKVGAHSHDTDKLNCEISRNETLDYMLDVFEESSGEIVVHVRYRDMQEKFVWVIVTVKDLENPEVKMAFDDLVADLDRALAIAKEQERNKIDDVGVGMV